MKQKDIALVTVIAIISAVISILLSNMLISAPKNRQMKATVVGQISNEFSGEDKKYFNKDSINPTKLIKVGNDNNTTPFSER